MGVEGVVKGGRAHYRHARTLGQTSCMILLCSSRLAAFVKRITVCCDLMHYCTFNVLTIQLKHGDNAVLPEEIRNNE